MDLKRSRSGEQVLPQHRREARLVLRRCGVHARGGRLGQQGARRLAREDEPELPHRRTDPVDPKEGPRCGASKLENLGFRLYIVQSGVAFRCAANSQALPWLASCFRDEGRVPELRGEEL